MCRVNPKGKPCTTLFTRLSFNGKTSLVRCECHVVPSTKCRSHFVSSTPGNPKTGRMHQIRVHLQWLGRVKVLYCKHYIIMTALYITSSLHRCTPSLTLACRPPHSQRSSIQPPSLGSSEGQAGKGSGRDDQGKTCSFPFTNDHARGYGATPLATTYAVCVSL